MFLLATYFVLGAIIGSFLNVCIYRLPLGMSIVSPPSHCDSCGHRLGILDMVPILSYIFLGGKCRYCHTHYSARSLLVEVLTGLLFATAGIFYLPGLPLLTVFVFFSCLIIITFIDFDHQIILDKFLLIMLVDGILFHFTYTKHSALANPYWDILWGIGVGGGLMLLIYLLSRGGMGEGDVKLSFVLGFWLGLKGVIVCLFLAFVLGGVVGVLLLATGIKKRKDPIPFGPYLCIGAYLSLLFGPYLIYYYWHFFAGV
ncbi:MAG: prepilin peptidase [Acidaminococcaceae bacterium]|jgi:leader peptidase (prepilin peptidase)/N-methyltransferase|nr:prepilin peptidase [Acidaminococcaceae bacterium]